MHPVNLLFEDIYRNEASLAHRDAEAPWQRQPMGS